MRRSRAVWLVPCLALAVAAAAPPAQAPHLDQPDGALSRGPSLWGARLER